MSGLIGKYTEVHDYRRAGAFAARRARRKPMTMCPSPCRASHAAQPLIEDARMPPIHSIPVQLTFALAVFALAIGGCATAPAPSDPARVAATAAAAGAAAATTTTAAPVRSAAPGAGAVSPTASAAAAAAAAAVAALSSQKPFAEVIKGAKEIPGFYNIYERDDKVWIEIRPEQFDQPFFFAFNFSSGLGEKWFFGGLMVDSFIASFHRLNPTQVQLIARNTEYFATPDTPEARAVREAFSDSLLSAAPVVSQPHPVRKSVLIEANALLLADIPGANGMLERTYRQTYSFDSRNSSITKVRATPDLVAINVNAHYALQRVSQPAAGASFTTSPPSTVPDIRSLFLGFYYNIAKLPEQPMRPRVADDRIGYFVQDRFDYSNDTTLTPKVNLIKRWRLEKKDPAAAMSEPKEPIVFWIDRNIPNQYRQTIIDGVLEWNKAFENAGFKDAVQAKIQPDDADFDTIDSRHASIRWMPTARPIFGGVGPIAGRPAHRRNSRRRHRHRSGSIAQPPFHARRADSTTGRVAEPSWSIRNACA